MCAWAEARRDVDVALATGEGGDGEALSSAAWQARFALSSRVVRVGGQRSRDRGAGRQTLRAFGPQPTGSGRGDSATARCKVYQSAIMQGRWAGLQRCVGRLRAIREQERLCPAAAAGWPAAARFFSDARAADDSQPPLARVRSCSSPSLERLAAQSRSCRPGNGPDRRASEQRAAKPASQPASQAAARGAALRRRPHSAQDQAAQKKPMFASPVLRILARTGQPTAARAGQDSLIISGFSSATTTRQRQDDPPGDTPPSLVFS